MDEFEALLASSRTAVERWVKARVSGRADAEDILRNRKLTSFRQCGFEGYLVLDTLEVLSACADCPNRTWGI